MKKLCDKCFQFFEVSPEYEGFCVICPNCGNETFVKGQATKRPHGHADNQIQQDQCVNTSLCFFLGLAFNLVGLLIAAIIGKQKGCISGLWGMLVADIIGVIYWLFFT